MQKMSVWSSHSLVLSSYNGSYVHQASYIKAYWTK